MASKKITPIIKSLKETLKSAIENDISNFSIDEIVSIFNRNAIDKKYDYLYSIKSEKDLIELLTIKKMSATTLRDVYRDFEKNKQDYPDIHTTYFFYNVKHKTFSFVNTIFIKSVFTQMLDEIVNSIIKKPFIDEYKFVYQKYIK